MFLSHRDEGQARLVGRLPAVPFTGKNVVQVFGGCKHAHGMITTPMKSLFTEGYPFIEGQLASRWNPFLTLRGLSRLRLR